MLADKLKEIKNIKHKSEVHFEDIETEKSGMDEDFGGGTKTSHT
jgi:hypothetical protein